MDLIEGHRPIKPPAGVPELDADPYADETLANPAAFYAQLRACGPFAYIPKYSMLACGRYAETSEVFSDWERFTSARGVGLQDFALEEPWRPPSKVLEVDPPFHTRTRRVLTRAMSPKAVADMKEMFRVEADRLVTALLERETFDGVTDFAEAYPTTVFLHRDGRVKAVHSGFSGPATGESYIELRRKFEGLIEELLAD